MRAKSVKVEIVFYDENLEPTKPVVFEHKNCYVDVKQQFGTVPVETSFDGVVGYVYTGKDTLELKVST